jgi:RNA polymerase sigma-70 factor (ECF subfamily)
MDGSPTGHITYCIVPADLAGELHDVLWRHFARDPSVEVVVERRGENRRSESRRRDSGPMTFERRYVQAPEGRRVGDQRAPSLAVDAQAELPHQAAPYAARLGFVERFAPAPEYLEDQDSARLVIRVQGGDFDAFAQLYERYFDRVYTYLRLGLGDAAAAEAGAQDTFVAILDDLPSVTLSTERPFRAWLFQRAGEAAAEVLAGSGRFSDEDRKQLAHRRAAQAADEPVIRAMGRLGDRELLGALAALPADLRQAVTLKYMLALSSRQIANVLGCSADEARVLYYRGRGFLSETLRQRQQRASGQPAVRRTRA